MLSLHTSVNVETSDTRNRKNSIPSGKNGMQNTNTARKRSPKIRIFF